MNKRITRSKKFINWVALHGKKPRASIVLSGLSIGDFFIPALPTQSSVILLSWLQPKKGLWIALLFALAAAIGTGLLIALALLLDNYLDSLLPTQNSEQFGQWESLKHYLNQYGLYALAVMSLLPTPPRTMVLLSLLAGLPIHVIISTVFMGKLVWFNCVVYVVSTSPSWLIKLPWVGLKIKSILLHQKAQLQQNK